LRARSGLEAFTSALDVYRGIVEDTRAGSICHDDGTVHLCVNDTIAVDLMEIERFMRYTLYGPFDMRIRILGVSLIEEGPEQRYRLFFTSNFSTGRGWTSRSFVVSPLVRPVSTTRSMT
jgi:hypothetical protein